ncbi:MAG: ribonucleotide reductase N-terminal alpha domain-containing protein [Candidatus Humimicrobiaceae bacterium]
MTGKDPNKSYYLNKKLNLTKNAVTVLERRYLKRDEYGNLLEEPRDMFLRVAKNIASVEKQYNRTEAEIREIEKKYFDIMTDLDFLPNSPTLMNAGRELQQLAACFVLPVGDSMASIFEALKETALIQKSGGGVGYSFSNIRPKNDVVLSTKGVSSGPISFMTVFNAATDTIKQGGTRRGANMGILRVDHPDILEFITAKEDNEKLNNFNISVGVTEAFMKAVENDGEYDILNPRTKEVVTKYKAREVFEKIINHAWKNGDPGIIFLDRLNKDNPTPHIGTIESTNPCISEDMMVLTNEGFIRAKELFKRVKAGEEIKIVYDKRALEFKLNGKFNNNNFEINENLINECWNRGRKEVYKLTTCSGFELEATPDHKVLTAEGYKALIELKKDDEILIQPFGMFKFNKLSEDNYYNKFVDKVSSVKLSGEKEVYDFNEPVSNSFIANGIVVRNCGEQPLLPYEACNLGSINLANMVREDDGIRSIDFDKLREVTRISVRFLDDVIDAGKYPLEKITTMVKSNRKIGLGVMGFADMLLMLEIPYNSEQALEISKNVMSFINDVSKEESRELAVQRGEFPNFKGSVYDTPDGYKIRNATTTTIAPTGTLSIIASCSSGIEPVFAISFVKNVMDNDKLIEVNPYFEEAAKKDDFYSKELMEIIAQKGSLKEISDIPDNYKRIFVTAHDIAPIWHVRMQAAFQGYVDNAVSKTVNFPSDATVKDVEDVYMLAYRLGCKGITIYRDKSRESQVLTIGEKDKTAEKTQFNAEEEKADIKKLAGTGEAAEISVNIDEREAETDLQIPIKPRPRPEVTKGMTKKYVIGSCGKLYVTVNSDEKGICEVFTNTGEEGCAALSEALSRLISVSIRAGIDITSITHQILGIRCITCIADRNTHVLSCPDAIGKALEFSQKGINKFDLDFAGGPRSIMMCPEEGCGGIMEPEGGCYVCRVCGFSKCS